MKPIICIGHAALDRIYRIDKFPTSPTKIRALEHIEAGGGMASNAAATIAKLGGVVEMWSRVGDDDNGVKVRRALTVAGVDARYVQSFDDKRTSTSVILVDGAGERLIVGSRDVDMPSSTEWLPLERVGDAGAVLADLRWIEGARVVLEAARAQIHNEKMAAMTEVKNQVAQLAIDMSERILRAELKDAEAQKAMVDRAMQDVKMN